MGDDFLLAFSQLSKGGQKKTRDFVEKFRSNPLGTGLNYETIKAAKDPNLRSLRVDQDHRAIVLKPEKGNIYILLWVDKHDDAYAWAQHRVCSINPNTGSIQVLEQSQETEEPAELPTEEVAPVSAKVEQPGLFDPFKDNELLELGIPRGSVADVRRVISDDDLDRLEKQLPQDAFEALYYLAVGGSFEETKRELGIDTPEEVDTEDFSAALERESSRRKFLVISDSEEMDTVLAYPLDRWRTFLHPSQRRLVEMNARGPVRVLGGAGTGKTVVAIHRAKWLAERVCHRNEKVLFTTYTKNLAADIQANLKKICSHETLGKIEVKNLDAWANQFLSGRSGKNRRVDFKGDQTKKLWEEALTFAPTDCGLTDEELQKEWLYVVQAQGIKDAATYIRVPRIGMGKALSRAKRKAIWPVFEENQTLQKENGICEPIEVLRMAREYITEQNLVLDYRAVIIDEAQDFSAEAFKLANSIVPEIRAKDGNHLFIVGDAHQRLYGHKVILSHCGIDIRGRGRRLRINYRTSEETRNWAASILENCPIDDLDGGLDSQKGYRSLFHGEDPVLAPQDSEEKQASAILEHIKGLQENGAALESICVVARTHRLVNSIENLLTEKGIKCHQISNNESDDAREKGVRLATMHRVKGIEFDHMVLAHMEASEWWSTEQELSLENRSLIYVAATRARKSVFVSSASMPLIDH
jgi:hypothetical protein